MTDMRLLVVFLSIGQFFIIFHFWTSIQPLLPRAVYDNSQFRVKKPGINLSVRESLREIQSQNLLPISVKSYQRTLNAVGGMPPTGRKMLNDSMAKANDSKVQIQDIKIQVNGDTALVTAAQSNGRVNSTGGGNASNTVQVAPPPDQLPALPTNTPAGAEGDAGANQFLKDVFKECTKYVWNREATDDKPRCPCVPPHLVGRLEIDEELAESSVTWDSLNKLVGKLGVQNGGHWSSVECGALQRLAIVIPCRDRESHLRALLHHLLPILVRQQVHFRIFVVEQSWPGPFNKGSMMNIGYKEALKLWDFDCVLFHDVDLLLQDDRNLYRCRQDGATHFGAYLDRYNFGIKYPGLFGGVVTMRKEHFEAANGFSTLYFGWGGEDDDFAERVTSQKIKRFRPPPPVARYITLKHVRDATNQVNPHRGIYGRLKKIPWMYRVEGLNSVQYAITKVEYHQSYTFIMADLEVGSIRTYHSEEDCTYTQHKGRCRSTANSTEKVSRITCQYMCNERTNCTAYSYTEVGDEHCFLYLHPTTCTDARHIEEKENFETFLKTQDGLNLGDLHHEFQVVDYNQCRLSKVLHHKEMSDVQHCARACDKAEICFAFRFYKQNCLIMKRPKCSKGTSHKESHHGPAYEKLGLSFSKFTKSNFRMLGDRAVCESSETISAIKMDSHNCAILCHRVSQCVGFMYSAWLYDEVDTCVLLSSCTSMIKSHREVYTFLKLE